MYAPMKEWNKKRKCDECGRTMKKLLSVHQARAFVEQDLNVALTDRKTGDEKVLHARNRQDVKDAINRYNDTPEASKTGKISQVEILSQREF